ncbi:8354_t:CDS:2 [Funneliformis geosporum]|uniref:6247_t:CDS:1 n=1 Tax=Funneliformis geosporum TaxID=1117311 RepID=A0A9W4SX10_9GLOM|nr:6247_t:CDS:2 [Funneliformis geosporum]CAI2185062.1 8354_t:CDS:2 [Funneliformis geosporum]
MPKKKLNQAKISNNKKELVNALKKTQNTTQNSSENKLGQVDQEELRRIIKEELKPEEVKNICTEVLNEAGVITLEKLIVEVQQAIKLNNQKSIKSKVKKLKIFVKNTADEYAQNAYQQKKEVVQKLLKKAKGISNTSQNPKTSDNKFLTGLVIRGGILAVIGLITILIIKNYKKKISNKELHVCSYYVEKK